MKKVLVLVFTLGIFYFNIKCSNGSTVQNQKDCKMIYNESINHINNFYIKNDKNELQLSLSKINSYTDFCSEYRNRFYNAKITVLMLMKDFKQGYEFVNTLKVEEFQFAYKKNLYLKTFKALLLEKEGNLIDRNKLFLEITEEISTYLLNDQLNKEALSDLFYTKIRFQEIEGVLNDLEIKQKENEQNREFLEILKETLLSMPKD